MKRILTSLLLVLLLCSLAAPALAGSGRTETLLVDNAGLLNSAGQMEIEEYAEEMSNASRCDIVIWTVGDTANMDVETYTENIYHSLGYGWDEEKSGVILLISMCDRSYDLYTYGRCDYLPYGYWSDVENDVVSYLAIDDWYNAFRCFIWKSAALIQREQKIFNSSGSGVFFRFTAQKLLTSLIIGVIPAIIVAVTMKGKMKSAVLQTRADRYAGEIHLTQQEDRYLRTDVVRVRHETSSSGGGGGGGGRSGGGGGGGSHHSGHF